MNFYDLHFFLRGGSKWPGHGPWLICHLTRLRTYILSRLTSEMLTWYLRARPRSVLLFVIHGITSEISWR